MKPKCLPIAWTLAVVGVAGCEPSPLYVTPEARQNVVGRFSPRSRWRAYGTIKEAANAIDDSLQTLAVADASTLQPSITLDFGSPCFFNMVVVDHGRNEFGFAQRVTVLTSPDGRQFTPRYVGAGTRRVSIFFLLPRFELARYLRIRADAPGPQPWSIAEIYLQ